MAVLDPARLEQITAIAKIERFGDVPLVTLIQALVQNAWNSDRAIADLDALIAIHNMLTKSESPHE